MKESTLRLALLPLLLAIGCSGQTSLRLPFQGLSSHSVHRFFPDLDRRENAVRYGRWRALESAWTRGAGPEHDAALEDELLAAIHRLPGFPPDARLCAPRLARQAPAAFGAILEADRLESETADALAATDSSGANTKVRIEKSLTAYRRSRYALSESGTGDNTPSGDVKTARLLREGDWLFARSAEDLAVANFREQRWRVRATVDRYDREVEEPPDTVEDSGYARTAPEFTAAYPLVAASLDRAIRFRIEVFDALRSPDASARRAGLKAVEKRYGLR